MIRFNCQHCGRAFAVRDQDAGRHARCKTCGSEVTVPSPSAAVAAAHVPLAVGAGAVALATASAAPAIAAPARPPTPALATAAAHTGPTGEPHVEAPRRIPMRLRRLTADARQMQAAFASFPSIRVVSTEGDPPEVYRLEYHVKSLERGKRPNQPIPRETHLVEIQLTSEYPRQSPLCRMLTPVFHPNIDPATICVGDHWAAGERLVDLAVRIGEMLAYQAYNIKSPLDAEAAMWADLNQDKLPVDPRDLRPAEA